ncbi:MAG TPA: PilN domain-containing protein [Bradyrhizobium sp.]|nr:PilN domain-containing protein [Bradyrhizobium sp.]
MISDLRGFFEAWIAAVARAVDFGVSRYGRRPQIVLSAQDDDVITASVKSGGKSPALPQMSFRLADGRPDPGLPPDWQAAFRGSRIEMRMTSGRVLLRSLDFPKQAGDFLEGMIRAQIDRLTPWTADNAVFGWDAPSMAAHERIELTLAAASKQDIQPFIQFASALGAESLALCAMAPTAHGSSVKIKMFDQPLRRSGGRGFDTPRLLRAALLSAGLAVALSWVVALYVGDNLDSELQQLTRRISERRAALRLGPNGASTMGLLAKRKQTSPSSVVVLEALSQALPDGTYVTELRVDGDKVQVVGMTQDAPSLIRLIERSPQFARATFFAPTTRAANEPGERFHIEAHITPTFGPGT